MLIYHLASTDDAAFSTRLPASFKCLVLIEREVTQSLRQEISQNLVNAGCRWVMAWGRDATLWDDSVDDACLERFNYGDPPAEAFVLTTWHDHESLADVIGFAKNTAKQAFDDRSLSALLVFDMSAADRASEIEAIYDAA